MTAIVRRRILLTSIFGLPFVLFFSVLLYELAHPTFDPLAPLPKPNGYDDFVKAGAMIPTHCWNYDSATPEALREAAAADAAALTLARSGLTHECRVPLQFTPAYPGNHLADLVALRRLAEGWMTAGRLAEVENHPAAAAQAYLDDIQFGLASGRGGTLVDQMAGIAIEEAGTAHLQALIQQLDAPTCRKTAAALEGLQARRPTWDQVMQQENDWSRRTFRSLRYEITRLLHRRSMARVVARAEVKFQEQNAHAQQLMTALATRAYALEHGHAPAAISDLVPDYLKAVPGPAPAGTNATSAPQPTPQTLQGETTR